MNSFSSSPSEYCPFPLTSIVTWLSNAEEYGLPGIARAGSVIVPGMRLADGPSSLASLRTRDPAEAKAWQSVALAHLEAQWTALRAGPLRLTQRQIVALSGEVYRAYVGGAEDDPGTADRWDYIVGMVESLDVLFQLSADVPEGQTGIALVDTILARHGMVIDRDSAERLLAETRRVLREGAERLRQNALGDYSLDSNVQRFPPVQATPSAPQKSREAITISDLMKKWWGERQHTGTAKSTYVTYRGVLKNFAAFLDHDDAALVTPVDVVAYKDQRLADGISPRTIKDGDLAALKSVFGWGVSNHYLPSNPAQGITLRGVRAVTTRDKWFTDEEATALLGGALEVPRGSESHKVWLAKRWVPWVLAYTGARVGEIVQLRKQDLLGQGDHWEIDITPEAGTVKGGHHRRVPLHPHLVDLGFVRMVEEAPSGHLFLEPNDETGDVLGPLQGVKNRIAEFARKFVPDPRVLPNHGWRHLFIQLGRVHGMSSELRDMITGHTGATVSAREYGGAGGLYREIQKLPRFEVANPSSGGERA